MTSACFFATKVASTNIPKSYFRSFDVTSLANHREGWQHVIGLRHAGEGIPGACNREEGDLCHATNDFDATATKDTLERGLWMFRNSTVTSQVCDVLLRLRRLTASSRADAAPRCPLRRRHSTSGRGDASVQEQQGAQGLPRHEPWEYFS